MKRTPGIVRACLDCGWPTPVGGRCSNPSCRRHRYRPSRGGQPERSHAERQRRKAIVDNWVRLHGWTCPGYKRPPHPSHYLQADHLIPVSLGGDPGGQLGVLCRACNVAKGGANRIPRKSR